MESHVSMGSLFNTLCNESFLFDYFQAVRLLERFYPERQPVGRRAPSNQEVVRFKGWPSLSFPPSSIVDFQPSKENHPAIMTIAFMGLTGLNGALPRPYTELIIRLKGERIDSDKHALQEWFDLFNHRLVSFFFRAWEKYRFFIPYERREYERPEPDAFTRSLFSLIGIGTSGLRDRLIVELPTAKKVFQPSPRVDDLTLIYYSGLFSHRTRSAVGLEMMLQDYFRLPIRILQFQGQWLVLEEENQSRLGEEECHSRLGSDLVLGERVWNVEQAFRVQIGPLTWAQFNDFIPDETPRLEKKAFFLLCHLTRFYVGPEFDFDIQLVLMAKEVPDCQLPIGDEMGPALGWTTWIRSQELDRDGQETIFPAPSR
jgi:type VI secretion system protein ImpH